MMRGAHRVEHVCACNPDLADRVGMIALRFIQEKGLSSEFADLLEEIDRGRRRKALPSREPDQPVSAAISVRRAR